MSEHYLSPLLNPTSIALVGASQKTGSTAHRVLQELRRGGFKGEIYPVNPRYEEVSGLKCYASIGDISQTPDMAVLLLSSSRLEKAVADCVNAGVGAATIFDGAHVDGLEPPLPNRIQNMAADAAMPICGANCVGFLNISEKVRVTGWTSPHDLRPGSVTFISHSGAIFEALVRNERRLAYNLLVASGQELTASVDQYIDYSLSLPDTRVIGIFLESIRHPARFMAALERAAGRDIPVVILNVGRSAFSAELAKSHSGAIAGNEAVYRALFAKYGVIQVDDMEEMVATLLLLSHPRRARPGKLIALHDSGGERELVVDMAEKIGVEFVEIGGDTKAKLEKVLHPSLRAVNPLDFYGGPDNAERIMEDSIKILMNDDNAGLGILFANVSSGFADHEAYHRICHTINKETSIPLALSTVLVGSEPGDYPLRMQEHTGNPVLFGARPTLVAAQHVLDHAIRRQSRKAEPTEMRPRDTTMVDKWHSRLLIGKDLAEAESMTLISEFGLPTEKFGTASDLKYATELAASFGWPVVLKTAVPDILHKTEVRGVVLGINNEEELALAYADLNGRLGPEVIVAKQAQGGIELALGTLNDSQFGPMVMVAAGGIAIEILKDVQYAMAPVSLDTARTMLGALKIAPLLQGHRGAKSLDTEAAAEAIVALSELAITYRDRIEEVDINPFLVKQAGASALDALIITKSVK